MQGEENSSRFIKIAVFYFALGEILQGCSLLVAWFAIVVDIDNITTVVFITVCCFRGDLSRVDIGYWVEGGGSHGEQPGNKKHLKEKLGYRVEVLRCPLDVLADYHVRLPCLHCKQCSYHLWAGEHRIFISCFTKGAHHGKATTTLRKLPLLRR